MVIVNFPSEKELKRLYPKYSTKSRFIITLNPDRSFNSFYKSINLATKELRISHHTIEKYVNTGILYMNLLFYSDKN